MNKKIQANLSLIFVAFIWGSAFVAQIRGMDYIGPFTYQFCRNVIGGLFLIPFIIFIDKKKSKQIAEKKLSEVPKSVAELRKKNTIIAGIICGFILFIGAGVQQVGLQYTTASKAGFISTIYVIIVPIMGLFLHKKVRPLIWVCVLIASIGLYLLSIKEGFSISKGDFIIFLSSIGFACHILAIDYFSPKIDGVRVACLQFFVCALLSIVIMVVFEKPTIVNILKSWAPILYAGILSSGVGFTIQVLAQKHTDPTVASLLMSLESVFAMICGMVILKEVLTQREVLGCILMFVSTTIAQLPEKKKDHI